MRTLEVRFTAHPQDLSRRVGTLAEDRGRIHFEYEAAWLETGLDLSPFRLPFRTGLFEHRDTAFGPLPGVFDDSLPDGWGMLLMDRHFRSQGREPSSISPLERLAWLGNRTMGALTYHPPEPSTRLEEEPFDLDALAGQSQDLLTGRTRQVLPQLLRAGGSPGGACPKVLAGFDPVRDELRTGEESLPDGFEAWIIKFPAREDECQAGAAEYAYALMAAAAGLDVPETRLFETGGGGRYFGIKRFDREGNRRFHVHTFGNLIQTNFRIPSCDYLDLLRATALLTRDHSALREAFRRMVFNVLAHNRDDHAKNFAFLLDAGNRSWSLAPAYDLTFSRGPGGEHSMTLAGEGRRPGAAHFTRVALERDLKRSEAEAILEEVRAAVARWPEFAERAKVSGELAADITRALG